MSLKKINEVKADRGFKIFDLIIYGAVLAVAAALFLAVFLTRDNSPLAGIRITVAEQTVYEYDFKEGEISCDASRVEKEDKGEIIVLTVRAGNGYNTVEINKSGSVKVTSADCGKRDCVYTPELKDNNGLIYCSPHKLKIMPYDYDPDGGTIII